MLNTYLKVLLICILTLNLTGCATAMRGMQKDANVFIETDPSGATIQSSGQTVISPGSLNLSRFQNHKITIKKEGYKAAIITLVSKTQGKDVGASFLSNTAAWGWWTLGIGTAAGMLVDAVSGSMKDLEGTILKITLEPGEGTSDINASDLISAAKKATAENVEEK